jgi:hypothetical protein
MRRSSGVIVSAFVLASVAVPAALAGKPIGPNQAFEANVNGVSGGAVVHTVCVPNAVGAGGRPKPGQYVQAKKAKVVPATDIEPSPFGFTGDATSIVVTTQPTGPSTTPTPSTSASGSTAILVVATLNKWGKKAPIPTSLPVPCSGTGTFAFRPVASAPGAVTAFVQVTFEP